jgi:hypothetical protein
MEAPWKRFKSVANGAQGKKKPPEIGGWFGVLSVVAFRPLDRRYSVRRKNKQSKNAKNS